MATVTGPDFIALQVRDLDAAADFYESRLGLRRAPASPPGAVVFATSPVPFAVRTPLPGTDLDSIAPRPGAGVALWLACDDAQVLHDDLVDAGVEVLQAPFDSPFGRTFTFADPDGYAVTVHGWRNANRRAVGVNCALVDDCCRPASNCRAELREPLG